MSDWYYFGCNRESGHYLFDVRGNKAYGGQHEVAELRRRLGHFDGCLPPQPEGGNLYQAALTRFYGLGYSALAWWDRSVDKRGASNSIVFAPHMNIAPEVLLSEAMERMPWVFSQTPQPVVLWTRP